MIERRYARDPYTGIEAPPSVPVLAIIGHTIVDSPIVENTVAATAALLQFLGAD